MWTYCGEISPYAVQLVGTWMHTISGIGEWKGLILDKKSDRKPAPSDYLIPLFKALIVNGLLSKGFL